MKIALLAGQNSTHTVKWANALAKRSHEIHLITQHNSEDLIDSVVKIHKLPFESLLGYFLNIISLQKKLKKINPDLLHVHYASGYGTLGNLSRFHPQILSVWGSDVYDFPRKSRLHKWLVASNLANSDWVCSTSHVMAKQAKLIYPKIENMTVTPFGIDTDLFKPLNEIYQEKNKKIITIGTVKRLAYKYGIDTLIIAFARLREKIRQIDSEDTDNLRLLIVGDGPERNQLEKLVKELRLSEVTTFTGNVPNNSVCNYLNKMDIYVALSRLDSESFGVAILEASSCELPVVVSNVGGLPEVVEDQKTGFIVPKDDPDAAASAILKLIQNSSLRKQMGQEGRKIVLKSYKWSDNVTHMEQVYQEVLKRYNLK